MNDTENLKLAHKKLKEAQKAYLDKIVETYPIGCRVSFLKGRATIIGRVISQSGFLFGSITVASDKSGAFHKASVLYGKINKLQT